MSNLEFFLLYLCVIASRVGRYETITDRKLKEWIRHGHALDPIIGSLRKNTFLSPLLRRCEASKMVSLCI